MLVALAAVAVYLLIRVIERRGVKPRRRGEGGTPAEPRVTGPDDDPDFLRDLDIKRRDDDPHRQDDS